MKKKIVSAFSVLYLFSIVFFYFGSGYLRDAMSYHLDVTYMFYHESEYGNSLYTVTEDLIYYDEISEIPYLYILLKQDLYEDDGYYIQKLPVSVKNVGDGYVFLGQIGTNQNTPIIITPVTDDMYEKRAVIVDTVSFE